MEEIKIKGKCFNYEPEQLSYETSVVIDKDIARENLLLFKKIADRNNFNFLIFYGTLLGAIREHDFISHDIDIDVVTNDEDKLLEIIPELINNGFKFIRYESSPSLKSYTTLYSFRRSSVYIDVYIAYKEKNKYKEEKQKTLDSFYDEILYPLLGGVDIDDLMSGKNSIKIDWYETSIKNLALLPHNENSTFNNRNYLEKIEKLKLLKIKSVLSLTTTPSAKSTSP